jgi:hypothetical protein
MSRFTKGLGLLVCTTAIILSTAGLASATTVVVSPGGSVAGTGTTSWELVITPTGGGSAATFNCTGAGFTAALASSPTLSTNYQQNFSGCRVAGISYTDSCTATGRLTVTGLTVSGITPATLSGISCVASVSGSCRANVTGSLTVTFNNTTSQLTVPTTGQSIVISGSTCTSVIPNGTGRFASSTGGAFVYNVSPFTTITAS